MAKMRTKSGVQRKPARVTAGNPKRTRALENAAVKGARAQRAGKPFKG